MALLRSLDQACRLSRLPSRIRLDVHEDHVDCLKLERGTSTCGSSAAPLSLICVQFWVDVFYGTEGKPCAGMSPNGVERQRLIRLILRITVRQPTDIL